jgi:hypothetical protein
MYLGDKKSLTLLTQSRIELAAVEVRLVRELLDLVRPPSRSTSYATSRPRTGVLDAACPMSLTLPSSLSLSLSLTLLNHSHLSISLFFEMQHNVVKCKRLTNVLQSVCFCF